MVITNRELAEGTQLTATYKKQVYTCTVLRTDDGKTAYTLEGDSRVFSSPSAAGSAVMGGVACNGWRFWSVAGEGKAMASPATRVGTRTRSSAKNTTRLKQIRKVPNQQGVPEGSTKFFCSACMNGFVGEGTEVPETCPQGHAREVVDELATAD